MRRKLFLPLLLLAASCLSPTLPLPPPEEPDTMHDRGGGTWTIGGTCQVGAIVTVFDETKGIGRVVEDRSRAGRYSIDIVADKCDTAWVTEQLDAETSSQTSFVVQERKPGDPTGTGCQ